MRSLSRTWLCLAALFTLAFASSCAEWKQNEQIRNLSRVESWFVLYDGDPDTAEVFRWEDYDMAILDPDSHPPLDSIPPELFLIAYVSLGRVGDYRPYWPELSGRSWISKVPTGEKRSYFVDVRDPEWKDFLIQRVIPAIKAQGFKGIFMDDLDSPLYLEKAHPGLYGGSKKAITELVGEIRRAFPELALISNNGFEILPEIGPFLSGLLAESVHSGIDSNRRGFERVSDERRKRKIWVLNKISKRHGLPVFVLDYASEDDLSGINQCIQASKRLGYKPYVAGLKLDRVYAQG